MHNSEQNILAEHLIEDLEEKVSISILTVLVLNQAVSIFAKQQNSKSLVYKCGLFSHVLTHSLTLNKFSCGCLKVKITLPVTLDNITV